MEKVFSLRQQEREKDNNLQKVLKVYFDTK